MADTWPGGDPLERKGGFLSGIGSMLGTIGSGVQAGVTADMGRDVAGKFAAGATSAVLGQYPGYGDLWTYDGTEGVDVTPRGWVVLGAAGVALWLVLFSGGR